MSLNVKKLHVGHKDLAAVVGEDGRLGPASSKTNDRRALRLTRWHIPNQDHAIRRHGHDLFRVRAEGDRSHSVGMSKRWTERLARQRVPHSCGVVPRASDNLAAVAREGGRFNGTLMLDRFTNTMSIAHVPNKGCPV